MEEGRTRQHHGELAGVVGIVEPRLVIYIPCMKPSREPHNPVSGLPPHPGSGERDGNDPNQSKSGYYNIHWIAFVEQYLDASKQTDILHQLDQISHYLLIWPMSKHANKHGDTQKEFSSTVMDFIRCFTFLKLTTESAAVGLSSLNAETLQERTTTVWNLFWQIPLKLAYRC